MTVSKKITKYLFNLLLWSVILFLYAFSNSKNALKKIQKIEIQFISKEPYFLSKSVVNELLMQDDQRSQKRTKHSIDLHELEQKVSENPYVEKASLYITLDGTLHSLIKPRQPIARVLENTSSYYIDSHGLKLPLSENYSVKVPLVTGTINKNNLSAAIKLLERVANDSFLDKEIVGIHFQPPNECVLTVRSGNYRIEFGELTEIDRKVKKLKAFYGQLFLDRTIHQYETINIKYRNQVIGVKK